MSIFSSPRDLIVVASVAVVYFVWAVVGLGNIAMALGFSVLPILLFPAAYILAEWMASHNAVIKWVIFSVSAIAIGLIFRPVG